MGTQCNMECLPHVAPLPSMSALYYPSLQFLDALDLIVGKKGVPLGAVVAAVAGGGGPAVNNTTVGEFVKFHDDKSTYTGKPEQGQGGSGAAEPGAAGPGAEETHLARVWLLLSRVWEQHGVE